MNGGMVNWRMLVALSTLSCSTPVQARDLPDLIISKAELSVTGDCSGRTPLITGQVWVQNSGLGRGQIFTTREMIVSQVVGRADIRGGDRFVNSLKPGESVVVNIRIGHAKVQGLVGAQTVELTVDPNNVFEEENERNNAFRVTVEVRCN